ncbi:MAG: exo-alpha-sialidase [Acidobacteria bacterium]|nr:exo-alpha-sialidase [Acidobacteriota bacterium]
MRNRALAFALTLCAASAGELRIERLFGPEIKTGPYKHPASITELSNGDLFVTYYGGSGEYANRTGVFGSRYSQSTKTWAAPKLIASDPFRSVGNGVPWLAPDGVLWLFYVVRWGDTWSTSRIQAKISRDNGETWSESYVVSEHEGMMVRGRPIALASGEYLLPAYWETGFDPESVAAESSGWFLRWDPKKAQWLEAGRIRSPKGNIQPAAVELSPGHLIAYCRRGGGYGPVKDGYIVRSESSDGGRSWSEGRNSQFPNPNAAIDFIKLRDGHLLLVYNASMSDRDPLRVALSEDQDRTWPFSRDVATGPHDYAYPVAIQTRDGKIHLVYTSEQRTVVNHAVFDEDWVKGK